MIGYRDPAANAILFGSSPNSATRPSPLMKTSVLRMVPVRAQNAAAMMSMHSRRDFNLGFDGRANRVVDIEPVSAHRDDQ